MSALPQPGSNRLPVIAASINDHLASAAAATRRALEHAIAAGALFVEAKELLPHGEWLPWLRANGYGERQVRTYMRLWRYRHRLKSAVAADLTIAAAEALVGKPKPERPHGLPGQLDLLGLPPMERPSVSTPDAPDVDPIADDLIDQLLRAGEEEGVSIESLYRALRRRMGDKIEIRPAAAPHEIESITMTREDFRAALAAADFNLKKVEV